MDTYSCYYCCTGHCVWKQSCWSVWKHRLLLTFKKKNTILYVKKIFYHFWVYFFLENLALWPSVFPWWLIDRNICRTNLTMLFSLRSLANNKLKALPRDSFIDLDSLIELWVVMHVHSMCSDYFFNCIKHVWLLSG